MADTRVIRTARTAHKTHYCGIRSNGCTRLIRPGDRYIVTATPPTPALQGELAILGGTGWRQIRSCASCVQALYGQTPDELAPRRARVAPAARRDDPDAGWDDVTWDRPVETVHLPAHDIA